MTNEELRIKIAIAKGYKWYCHVTGFDNDKTYTLRSGEFALGPSFYPIDEVPEHGRIGELFFPNWPEDIAAAWELVEEMAIPEHVGIATNAGRWNVSVDNYSRTLENTADTAARAICLAWLAWHAERAK